MDMDNEQDTPSDESDESFFIDDYVLVGDSASEIEKKRESESDMEDIVEETQQQDVHVPPQEAETTQAEKNDDPSVYVYV